MGTKDVVSGTFSDPNSHGSEGTFSLWHNSIMFPGKWQPPITWKGFINAEPVTFTQISHMGNFREYYDFTGFPADLEHAIDPIIKAIDKKMRVMD